MAKSITDSRGQQLEELKSFTDAVNKEIVEIVDVLDWTLESVKNVDREYLACSYDSSHRLTEASLNQHLTACQWKAEGYGKSDILLSEPTLPVNSPFNIKFDEQLQNKVLRKAKEQDPTMQIANYECYTWCWINISCTGERLVPRTSNRLLSDFTSDERRALYDYVIANTAKPEIGQDIGDINNLKLQEKEDKEMSLLELLVHERNLKRRRAKHRGVHTNKKSHIEILREVINQQMDIYTDYISGKTDSVYTTDVRSAKSENRNYETMQDRAEHLYKVFHASPRQDSNSRARNNQHHNKKDDNKKECFEEKSYHRSTDRDRREKYSDEYNEICRKHKHSERRKSSHSRDRKSYKKEKRRSKDRYTDKHHEKKHKSRDRDRSSERHYNKHSDRKRKERKNKDY